MEHWLRTRMVAPEPIDLPALTFTEVSNRALLIRSAALATPATQSRLNALFDRELERVG